MLAAGQDAAAAATLRDFDLAKVRPQAATCAGSNAVTADIVVCGRKKAMDAQIDVTAFQDKPVRVLGGDTKMEVEQHGAGGVTAPALMARLKWRF